MTVTEEAVKLALESVKYPGFSRNIMSFGLVKAVEIRGGVVEIQMQISTGDTKVPAQIRDESDAAVRALPGVEDVRIKIDIQAPPQVQGGAGPAKIDGIRHVIAVASGKGGVGKSTVAANLAIALSRSGARVGLCDCDLYGPSMGLMFGVNERPVADEENRIVPIERFGVRLMSMGFLTDDDSPAVLRGPMVTRYTQQFLRQVAWGELDYLVLDLPPGTGDIQLTIVQTVALGGAIIVTTPQEVALIDARKAATMFAKTNVAVLGLVENMSYFECPSDGKRYDLFGSGGAEREAARLRVPVLAKVPIEIPVREGGDIGRPVSKFAPDSTAAQQFEIAAQAVRAILP